MRVAVDGSAPEVICEANAWAGATWSPNGTVVFSRAHESGFERVPAGGGVPAAILEPEHGETLAWPVFLPDGEHFVFHQLGAAGASGIYVASLDGAVRKPLVPSRQVGEFSTIAFALPGYLLYVRDRVLLAHRLYLDRLEMVGEPFRVATDVEALGPAAAFGVSQSGVLAYWPGNSVVTQLTWVNRRGEVDQAGRCAGAHVRTGRSPARQGRNQTLRGGRRRLALRAGRSRRSRRSRRLMVLLRRGRRGRRGRRASCVFVAVTGACEIGYAFLARKTTSGR